MKRDLSVHTPEGPFSSSRASVLLQSRECPDGLGFDAALARLCQEESPWGRKELNALGTTLVSCDRWLLGLLSPLLSVNAEKRESPLLPPDVTVWANQRSNLRVLRVEEK